MQNGFLKGLKPQFIKSMALIMGVCYLMNPLQNQIRNLLHTLSHELSQPASVLSHQQTTTENQKIHSNHDHDERSFDHEHKVLDLVNSIFEASDTDNDSDESQLVKVKYDKHISTHVLEMPLPWIFKLNKDVPRKNHSLITIYLKKSKEPPRSFLS